MTVGNLVARWAALMADGWAAKRAARTVVSTVDLMVERKVSPMVATTVEPTALPWAA